MITRIEANPEELIRYFKSPIWANVQALLIETIELGHTELETVTDMRELHYLQGKLSMLKQVLEWPQPLIEEKLHQLYDEETTNGRAT